MQKIGKLVKFIPQIYNCQEIEVAVPTKLVLKLYVREYQELNRREK